MSPRVEALRWEHALRTIGEAARRLHKHPRWCAVKGVTADRLARLRTQLDSVPSRHHGHVLALLEADPRPDGVTGLLHALEGLADADAKPEPSEIEVTVWLVEVVGRAAVACAAIGDLSAPVAREPARGNVVPFPEVRRKGSLR